MASQTLKKLSRYISLFKRKIPKYPLYVKGNPQLRVYLPLFWMKIVRPKYPVPEDQICFEVHPQMTIYDVQNYLEKIYGVSVLTVRTKLAKGDKIEAFGPIDIREDHKRIVYVQLEEKFEIPDMFGKTPTTMKKNLDEVKEAQKEETKKQQTQWQLSDVPMWFR